MLKKYPTEIWHPQIFYRLAILFLPPQGDHPITVPRPSTERK